MRRIMPFSPLPTYHITHTLHSNQVDALLQEEAARVSKAAKDWNALAEQIRRERFLVAAEGACVCFRRVRVCRDRKGREEVIAVLFAVRHSSVACTDPPLRPSIHLSSYKQAPVAPAGARFPRPSCLLRCGRRPRRLTPSSGSARPLRSYGAWEMPAAAGIDRWSSFDVVGMDGWGGWLSPLLIRANHTTTTLTCTAPLAPTGAGRRAGRSRSSRRRCVCMISLPLFPSYSKDSIHRITR